MFHDTVECPYCEFENDMSDGTTDLPRDNKFDHECEECGFEFEVHVEFDPTYSASKIVEVKCEDCGVETREPYKRGKIFPFPRSLKSNVLCYRCFIEGHEQDYQEGKIIRKVN